MPIAINGSGTITGISAGGLPDATITQAELATGVGGTGPTCAVSQNASQTVSSGVFTKVQLNTEEWDTANCFDPTTNYRFTPNVAGYYQFSGILYGQGSSGTSQVLSAIYKNGSLARYGGTIAATGDQVSPLSCILYANGTTDYFELYGYVVGAGTIRFLVSGGLSSALQISMSRGA
jgi:hypothetical protein